MYRPDIADGFVDYIEFFVNILISMCINHAHVVVERRRFSMALHEKPQHRVVTMRIPSRQKNDMFPVFFQSYLMSMISALG